MAFVELDAHTLRALAVHLPNPAAFAACCKQASQAIKGEDFRLVWFSAHHRGCVPCRPWQYAVLTWQLHRRAQPEQIAAFILRFHDWSQQQRQQPTTPHANIAAVVQQAGPSTAAPTTLAGAASRTASARGTLLPPQHHEGYMTIPMECRLLPSTVRRAQQLLAKGRALDALHHLCPASTSVLFVYAAKSRNEGLLRQLVQHKEKNLSGIMVFPDQWSSACAGCMYLRINLSCSCAALASGDVAMLRRLLLCGGSLAVTWRGRLLLRYAARHSSAECLQELLFACQAHDVHKLPLVAPQHLVMAASRTDAWAAGVVRALLQALTPKQRKPANMRPAYKAACSSGCASVLQLLLGVAAAAPQQQLLVLLEAAAAAGNLQAWRQLLLQSGSSNQQQQPEGGAEAAASSRIDWSFLTVQQLARVLHLVLPNRVLAWAPPGTTQQLQWRAAEDASRLRMADLLWQVLVLQQGKEADLRQHLSEADAATPSYPQLVRGGLLLFSMIHFCSATMDRALWLQQRGLIPEQHLLGAGLALEEGARAAVEVGDFARALRLHQAMGRLSAALPQRPVNQVRVACCSVGGHLRRACAAGDAAAVAQLERLARFAERVFSSKALTSHILQRRVLLHTLLGRFMGRATTMGCLAEELGLPWQLLERLLVTNARAKASSAETPGNQQVQLEVEMFDVEETLQQAQDAAYTAKSLLQGAAGALQIELRALGGVLRVAAAQPQQLEAAGPAVAAAVGAQAAVTAAAGNGAAAQQQEPPNHMQHLVEQLNAALQQQNQVNAQANAELQQQNQVNAQANAALQQVQHMLQELQQAGVPEDDFMQLAAQALANLPAVAQQPPLQADDGQEEPEVLPQESMSRAELRRQLQQRLDAGERSIPLPQQAQLGPLPLWQQCVLELAARSGDGLADCVQEGGLIKYLTSGMLVADSATVGADACTPLQRLLGDEAFAAGPPVALQPPRLPWGRLVAQAAVELRRPQLLAWALQPEQRQRLWGSAHNAPKAALWDLSNKQDCTPISNAVSNHPRQQAADMQQLRVHRQQQLPGQPAFAELAADTALLLLNVTPNEEGLLSDWLQHGLHPGSSEVDLVRAKAVLAAAVGAEQLPAGAQLMRRDCLKQMQRIGDVDLLALVVLWGHRIPEED